MSDRESAPVGKNRLVTERENCLRCGGAGLLRVGPTMRCPLCFDRLAERLAQAMWQRQVAALDLCRRQAPRVLLALDDIGEATDG